MVWAVLVILYSISLLVLLVTDPPSARDPVTPLLVAFGAAWWLTIVTGPLVLLLAKNWKARLGLVGAVGLVTWLTALARGWPGCPPGLGHSPNCEQAFTVLVTLTLDLAIGGMLLFGRWVFRLMPRA